MAELAIAMGIGTLALLGIATVMRQMTVAQHTMSQDSDLAVLATATRFFLRNQLNCTLNMQPQIHLASLPAVGASFPLQSLNYVSPQTQTLTPQVMVQAGARYPDPSAGPIQLNSSAASPPGMGLVFKGTMGKDPSGANSTFSADLVFNGTKVGIAGQNYQGSGLLTSAIPLTLIINYQFNIVQCYADANATRTQYILDEICNQIGVQSGGGISFASNSMAHQIYDPTTQKCVSNCINGATMTASCPAGQTLTGCNANTTGVSYQPTSVLAPYVGASQQLYTTPPLVYVSLAGATCFCGWAAIATPFGTCQACCSPY